QPAQVYYVAPVGVPFVTFGAGFAIGWWLNCDFDWRNHNIIVWNHDHPRPLNWWHEPSHHWPPNHTTVWHPPYHPNPVVVHRDDNGWGTPEAVVAPNDPKMPVPEPKKETPVAHPPMPGQPPPAPVERPEPVNRPQPVNHPEPVNRPQPVNRPEPNGAFIGI